MKKLVVYMFILLALKANAQADSEYTLTSIFDSAKTQRPLVRLEASRTNLELKLYVDSFTLSKSKFFVQGYFKGDILLFRGTYHEMNDTLTLETGNRVFELKRETPEIYSLITPMVTKNDTLNPPDDKFLVSALYYPNGKFKQRGGWYKNRKDDIWDYSDSTEETIRQRKFSDGVLINDDYKLRSWEKPLSAAQLNNPLVKMQSSRLGMVLKLYTDTFTLSKPGTMDGDVDIFESRIKVGGAYYYHNDTLFLNINNKVFKLKKETPEEYSLITPVYINKDTLYPPGDKFLATAFYYPDGKIKEFGGWNNKGKDYIWGYYDSTGKLIRKRLFKDGVLVDDNFKWPEEK